MARDELGRFLPGESGNPTGRPNDKKFKEKLNKAFPDDLINNLLFSKLMGINANIADRKIAEQLINSKEFKKKFKRFSTRFKKKKSRDGDYNDIKVLSEKDQLRILEFIIERKYGKPKESIELDNKVVNISVDLPEGMNPEDI